MWKWLSRMLLVLLAVTGAMLFAINMDWLGRDEMDGTVVQTARPEEVVANRGRKNLLPSITRLTSFPAAIGPELTSAPIRLWVFDIGNPICVARKTVNPAPKDTDNKNAVL